MNTKRFCTSCGQPHEKGAMFCEKCGMKLQGDEISGQAEATRKGLSSKVIIGLIALVVVLAGSVAGYSMFAKSFSPDKVIKNTLALESGRIKIDYSLETVWGEENQKTHIDFIKNKQEKTVLLRDNYDDETYASVQDGKVLVSTRWYGDEFDLKDETGIDAGKLEKDLINYLATTFKGKKVPKGYLENIEKKREDGKYVIYFDVADGAGLVEWMYGCFDLKKLRDTIENNISVSDARSDFKYVWDYSMDEVDDNMDDVFYGIEELGSGLKTSVKLVVDKKGILDEVEVKVAADKALFGEDVNAIVRMTIGDKNQINSIKRP
jgi:hypothetical protein